MDLYEALQRQRAMIGSTMASAAATATENPDDVGKAIEAAPLVNMDVQSAIAQATIFRTALAEKANLGALNLGPRTVEWLGEDLNHVKLVSDEVPTIVDFEASADRMINTALGYSTIGAASRTIVNSFASMVPAFRLMGAKGEYETAETYVDQHLKALELASAALANGNTLGINQIDPANPLVTTYALMTQEQRDAKKVELLAHLGQHDKFVESLEAQLQQYANQNAMYGAGITRNATDIRSLKSLWEYLAFTGTTATADVLAAFAVTTAGTAVAGPAGGVTGLVGYGYSRSISNQMQTFATRDAPYTTDDIVRANFFALLSGGVEAVTGVGGTLKRSLVRGAYSDVTENVLKRVAQGYVNRIGRNIGREGVEEFFQEGAQYFLDRFGTEGSDFKWTDTTLLEAFNASIAGLTGGVIGGGTIGTYGSIATERALKSINEAGMTVRSMEELSSVLTDMKLPTRSPTAFKKLANQLGLANVPVFFQAADLQAKLTSLGLDATAEMTALGSTEADLTAALAANGQVALTAEALAKAHNTPIGKWLFENGTFSPETATPADVKRVNEIVNEIKQQVQEAADLSLMQPERRQVYNNIYGQLRRAGRGQGEAEAGATMLTAFYETQAQRYGMDNMGKLFERFGVQIKGPAQLLSEAAAVEAASAAIPDAVVKAIDSAVSEIEAGNAAQLDMSIVTPDVVKVLRALGINVSDTGAIPAEQVQQVRDAVIGMTDAVTAQETGGATLNQQPDEAVADDQDTVGPNGLRLLHGTTRDTMTVDDIQIVRTGQKQAKRGRTLGGFYMSSVADAAHATGYANMSGATGKVMEVTIAPNTKIARYDGDITRLSEETINRLRGEGYGLLIGKDVRGRTEYVAIDKAAIQSVTEQGMELNQRLVDTKNREARLLRSVEELEQYALGQMGWKDWYDRYQALLDDLFGQDADLMRKILAATSQAASVPANVGLALKAYEQMLSGQPFTGYLPAVIKNLERIREDIALSGQKIGQYGAAVTGDDEGIAIDRHVATIMFDTKHPTPQQVELGKQTVREIATRLGWKPREVQAALWAANIARSGKEPQSYDTYLIRKAEQIRTIRAAFSSPILGGSSAGDGAGGAVDQGTEDGGQTFFQSQLQRGADTRVAGGLTQKIKIRVRDILGATITPIFADLTSAGTVYENLDGMPVAPTLYFGGPNFPWLKLYRDAGVVWAFNDKGKITGLQNRVRELSKMNKANGGDGRVVVTVLAMKDDAHTSNEMAINALLSTLDAVVAAAKFPEGQLEAAKELVISKAKNSAEGYAGLASFSGFGDAAALADWSRRATFPTRKALAEVMRSADFQNKEGMFPVSRIVREAVDPDYRATQTGDMLLAFEIDPDNPKLLIDWDERKALTEDTQKKWDKANIAYTQETLDAAVSEEIIARYGGPSRKELTKELEKKWKAEKVKYTKDELYAAVSAEIAKHKDKDITEAEANPDIPRHPAYRFGMRGTIIGAFDTHLPMEVMYADLLKQTYDRIPENFDREQAEAKQAAEKDGKTFVPLTAEERAAGIESKQKNWTGKFALEKARVTDGQFVSSELVEEAETIEGLHDYRVAHAMLAGIAGKWRSSDDNANKGGIQPVEFERALVESDAAVTLTKYTRADVQEGQKTGKLRVFQLGSSSVQAGGLNVWMAVKKDVDYRDEYGGPVTEKLIADGVLSPNETALVGVVNNELGVKKMSTFQVLKGIEEGVTVLDAFKVRSASNPYGLLPTIYATLGFEEVGEIPFDPFYLVDEEAMKAAGKSDAEIAKERQQKLDDMKAVWTRQKWVEGDGYPTVAIMKWRGDDAARSRATERFVKESLEGLGFGANELVDALEASQSGVSDSPELGDQGDGVTGQGDGRANPRRFGDRARGLSQGTRDFVSNLIKADPRATKALKLDDALIAKIKETYAPELAASMVEDVEINQQQGATYNQNPPSGVRGSITFPTAGVDGNKSLIKLFESADQSTFLHEIGHFFLEAFSVMAADPAAPQQMKEDMQGINVWLGRDPADTSRFTRDQHEQWARGFEAYLMTGEAPSVQIRTAFGRFKRWLTNIYTSVVSLQVELSPEVTAIMDRMVATDEQIALVKAEQQIAPLLMIKPAGMSEEDYQNYLKAQTYADDVAHEKLLNKLMRQIRVERSREYRDALVGIKKQAEDDINAMPVYRLVDRLQTTDLRIDRQAIIDQFGESALAELSRSKLGGKTAIYKEDGVDPDVVAQMAGYPDATTMISELMDAKKKSIAIEARVSELIDQKFGDQYRSEETIREAARAALHSDERGRLLMRESKELARQAREAGIAVLPLSLDGIKAKAREMVAEMSMRQATKPDAFLRAERKAGLDAQAAFSKVAKLAATEGGAGKQKTAGQHLIDAYQAKQRQILNHYLFIESRKAEEALGKARKLAAMLNRLNTRKKLASPYNERIADLIDQYDLIPRTQKVLAARNNLIGFIQEMTAQGREGELAIPPAVIERAEKVHYTTLTYEQFMEVYDTLKNLEHLGRTKTKLLDAKRNRDYAQSRNAIIATLQRTLKFVVRPLAPTQAERREHVARTILNSILNADTIINKLDGNPKDVGVIWRELKEPISSGLARAETRQREAASALAAIYEAHFDKKQLETLRSGKISVPELGKTMSKAELLVMAMNTGNRINWERLTNKGAVNGMDASKVEAALKAHLTENDWRFVQAIWDYIGGYWPEISAQEKAITGVTPKAVEAQPQVKPFAFVTGGYFPIRYDPRLAGMVDEADANATLKNLAGGRFAKAQTKHGHTKERVATTNKSLLFSLSIIAGHINDVIYDLELRQPVQHASRLLNDEQVTEIFRNTNNTPELEALRLWVQDVANGDRAGASADAVFAHLRAGISIAKMGFSVTTLLQQPIGLLQSLVVVGKTQMVTTYAKYTTAPRRYAQAAVLLSPTLRERSITFQRDVLLLSKTASENPSFTKLSTAHKMWNTYAFYLIGKLQFWVVDVPTWMAAYDLQLKKGLTGEEATTVADQLLVRAQGSGLLSERSGFERGSIGVTVRGAELYRMMSAFGSFLFARLGVLVQKYRQAGITSPIDFVKNPMAALNFMTDVLIMYGVEAMLTGLVTGRLPEDDDDDEEGNYLNQLLLWDLKRTGLGLLASVPVGRDVASVLEGYGGGGVYGGALEGLGKAALAASDLGMTLLDMSEDEEVSRRQVQDMINGIGIMFHFPASQVNRILSALYDEEMAARDDVRIRDIFLGRKD